MPSALTTRVRGTLVFARASAGLVVGWLLLSGALAAARSLASATRPLAAAELIAAAIGLAGIAWGARAVLSYGRLPSGLNWRGLSPVMATSLAVVLWGISLTRGAGAPVAATFLWLVLLGEEGWAFWRATYGGRQQWRPSPNRAAASCGDLVIQEFTRRLSAQQEIVRGSLAVVIERGGRIAAGHVAFCPPLAERPHFEVQPHSTTKATLKVSHLYPHGARIEVRLPQAAQSETIVRLQFVARAPRVPDERPVPAAD